MTNRFDIAEVKKKLGGSILATSENLVKYIEVLTSKCEYVFWFKLSRNLSHSSSDILFEITYVPPENTY